MPRQAISVERENGEVVCGRCLLADNAWTRFRGLLGRNGLADDEGLLLRPAGSIHTLFMRFAIDAVFLDRQDTVVKIVRSLGPWRFAAARRAKRTLELPAGSTERRGLALGERLVFVPERAGEAA